MEDADFFNPDEWIDSTQLAKLLGKTRPALELQRAKGLDGPPWYRLGHNIRYRRSEVMAWMLSKRQVPAAVQLAQAD